MLNRIIVAIILASFTHKITLAQGSTTSAKSDKKAKRDSLRTQKVVEGKGLITPLLVPGYTPELGVLLAVGGLWSFKTNPSDTEIQRSSMPFTFSYTTTGAVVFNARPTTFWFQDKLRIYFNFNEAF